MQIFLKLVTAHILEYCFKRKGSNNHRPDNMQGLPEDLNNHNKSQLNLCIKPPTDALRAIIRLSDYIHLVEFVIEHHLGIIKDPVYMQVKLRIPFVADIE